jgi:signal transduction histidine kinase
VADLDQLLGNAAVAVVDALDADYEQYQGWRPDSGEQLTPEEWPLARALRGKEVVDPEVIEIRRFDGERRRVLFHAMPVRNASGEVTRAVVTMTDVTDREERQQRLEAQNDRLESFASMLAHELRNPVTIGQIYSQQLPDETDAEAVEYVAEAFDRIGEMIDVMLVLTRGREAVGERTPIDLADMAREVWDDVDGPEATLEADLDRTIQADETYVRHLFRNLFDNAVQHAGEDATVTVGDLPDRFYVADDGPGIPEDERQRVFEEGYTTAAGQGGTGLGLAFVQELADVYEWDVSVTESDEDGARFEFTNVG